MSEINILKKKNEEFLQNSIRSESLIDMFITFINDIFNLINIANDSNSNSNNNILRNQIVDKNFLKSLNPFEMKEIVNNIEKKIKILYYLYNGDKVDEEQQDIINSKKSKQVDKKDLNNVYVKDKEDKEGKEKGKADLIVTIKKSTKVRDYKDKDNNDNNDNDNDNNDDSKEDYKVVDSSLNYNNKTNKNDNKSKDKVKDKSENKNKDKESLKKLKNSKTMLNNPANYENVSNIIGIENKKQNFDELRKNRLNMSQSINNKIQDKEKEQKDKLAIEKCDFCIIDNDKLKK